MDYLDFWRIPLYLLPIALAMFWIRRRESLEGLTPFADLSAGQKAWVLISALPPGLSAGLLARLPGEIGRAYLQEGASIQGGGQHLLPEVLKEFCRVLPPDWTRGAGRDPDQALALVARAASEQPAELLTALTGLWPPAANAELTPAVPPTEKEQDGDPPAGASGTGDEEEA